MRSNGDYISAFIKDESGATAIEYTLLIGSIALVLTAAVTALIGDLSILFNSITAVLVAP